MRALVDITAAEALQAFGVPGMAVGVIHKVNTLHISIIRYTRPDPFGDGVCTYSFL